MIDHELARTWIAALESNHYTQTTGSLRDEVGHCCLGVLCDIVDPESWHPRPSEPGYYWTDRTTHLNSYGEAPSTITNRLALDPDGTRHDPLPWAANINTLITANDNERWSFPAIAAALRDYYGLPPREEPTNG